jgi:branched-chain amino acid aminotransferase
VSSGENSVYVENDHPRTVPLFSAVKTSSNYASSSLVHDDAKSKGYDTVLWLDSNKCVQELTTMNVFFVIDGEIITPRLGSILPGVTRRTVIHLLGEYGMRVREETLKIDTIAALIESGSLSYMFATATALGICRVRRLGYLGQDLLISESDPAWMANLLDG